MNRLEAWSVHLSALLVGGTGLVYAWMQYFCEPADPFTVVNHPWQPTVQHLHVLTAPLLVFAAGLIWSEHIWKHWKSGVKSRRRSGVGLLLTMVPMIASGYLIQTTVGPGWRTAWVTIHLVTSGLWLLTYLVHAVVGLRSFLRKRRAADRAAALRAEAGAPGPEPARRSGVAADPRVERGEPVDEPGLGDAVPGTR